MKKSIFKYAVVTLFNFEQSFGFVPISPISKSLTSVIQPDFGKSSFTYFSRDQSLDNGENPTIHSGLYGLLSTNDQTVVGVIGLVASIITLYSESVLKGTGCGLPAGPYGLVGAAEGISYLIVLAIGAFSLYSNLSNDSSVFVERDGKCLFRRIAGPGGLLVVAEGMTYLTIILGIAVLVMQIVNYGYIPNAVPVEGGMCM